MLDRASRDVRLVWIDFRYMFDRCSIPFCLTPFCLLPPAGATSVYPPVSTHIISMFLLRHGMGKPSPLGNWCGGFGRFGGFGDCVCICTVRGQRRHRQNQSKLYRNSIEHLSKFCRKSIEKRSSINRKSIEHLSIEHLWNIYRKSAEIP